MVPSSKFGQTSCTAGASRRVFPFTGAELFERFADCIKALRSATDTAKAFSKAISFGCMRAVRSRSTTRLLITSTPKPRLFSWVLRPDGLRSAYQGRDSPSLGAQG